MTTYAVEATEWRVDGRMEHQTLAKSSNDRCPQWSARAGREPKIQISASCAQTKRDHEALEFEVIEDFSVRSAAD